jgi:PiT family inorganic phosphate transporter
METTLILLVVIVALALVFDFINGFHDTANAIATVVSTRALSPLVAVVYAGVLNFAGAMMGTGVAATIGKGLVNTTAVSLHTVICTLIAAITWNLITWYKGLPTSSSHALIGSLLGATFFSSAAGGGNIIWPAVWQKALLPMFLSPVLGVTIGFSLMTLLTWMIYRMHPAFIGRLFGKLQIISAGFMAVNHGLNDAQKSMGIIALALLLTHPMENFSVPLWVKIVCSVAMCLGTMCGGWRIIRTLGSKMIKLQTAQGFAAETTASIIIGGASHFGIPVSTTHVISSAIMGVGTTKRFSAVRWGVVGNIVWAWVLTIPLTFLLAGGLMFIYGKFFL